MAEKSFTLEIVTPKKVVFKGEVESFSAPGVLGSFQVLYNHAPLLSAIKIGESKLTLADGLEKSIASSAGFVEVRKNHVVMLAESAELAGDIDAERAKAAEQRARKRLDEKKEDIDFDRAQAALHRALNRLKISGRL